MRLEISSICILLNCLISFASPVFAQREATHSSPEVENSFIDALTNGRIKALFRYSGQHRNSNLHLLQDSSTPEAPDEKVQQYPVLPDYSQWCGL